MGCIVISSHVWFASTHLPTDVKEYYYPAQDERECLRKDTVAENANALEEGNAAAEKLRVDRDDDRPDPEYDEDVGKLGI